MATPWAVLCGRVCARGGSLFRLGGELVVRSDVGVPRSSFRSFRVFRFRIRIRVFDSVSVFRRDTGPWGCALLSHVHRGVSFVCPAVSLSV